MINIVIALSIFTFTLKQQRFFKMEKKIVRQYILVVVILSLAIALTIHFPLVLRMIFDDGVSVGEAAARDHHHGGAINFAHTGVETVITFIVALVMFIMNYFILKPADKVDKLKPLKVVLAIGLTIVLVWLLNQSLFSISRMFDTETAGRGRRSEFDLTNFYVAGLVVGCVLIIRLVF